MALKQIETTESTAANLLAQRTIGEVVQLASRINSLRKNGVPARPAVDEQKLPDGRVIPARPSVPGISAEAYRAALGAENNAIFDALQSAIGIAE